MATTKASLPPVDIEKTPGLAVMRKIHALREEIKEVESSKMDSAGMKYNYLSENKLTTIIRPIMQKLGLVAVPVESESKTNVFGMGLDKNDKERYVLLTENHTEFRVVDIETGDSIFIAVEGSGADTMDKGTNKALTCSVKNFYKELLNLPSPERDDPDNTPSYNGGSKSYGSNDPGAIQLKYGAHAGKTLRQLFDENPEEVEKLANGNSKCLADLTAIVALGRPGPMTSGMVDSFFDVETPIVSWQKDFTEETRGCIIYQEQVMALCQRVWGMTLGEADMIRRAMGRKDKELMQQLVDDLSTRDNYVGLNKGQIEWLLDSLNKQASYLFNKSHAAAYAYTAYQTAYLKAHYPLQFYCALLNSNINQEDALVYLNEIRKAYKVYMPDIIKSDYKWTIYNGCLMAGFSYIKGVGDSKFSKPKDVAEEGLVQLLESNPNLNKRVAVNLVKAGCFDIDPQWGIDYIEWYKTEYKRKQECLEKVKYYAANRNKSLEWLRKSEEIKPCPIIEVYDTPIDIVSQMQIEVLGFSNLDIFYQYDKSLVRGNNRLFLVHKVDRFNDRNGNPMVKMYGRGQSGDMTCIFWNPKDALKEKLNYVTENEMLVVRTGQQKENNTYFCYDFVEAKKVA